MYLKQVCLFYTVGCVGCIGLYFGGEFYIGRVFSAGYFGGGL